MKTHTKLTVKAEWSRNGTYQNLYNKVKKAKQKRYRHEIFMYFKALYLEMDTSDIGLGSSFIADEGGDNVTLQPIAFASKSLSNIGWWYSNTERKALGILHGLKKFMTTALPRKYMSMLTTSHLWP